MIEDKTLLGMILRQLSLKRIRRNAGGSQRQFLILHHGVVAQRAQQSTRPKFKDPSSGGRGLPMPKRDDGHG
jgi:hypothetical protein